MAALSQPLNPLAQPFVSSTLKKAELSQDFKKFLSSDPQALDKIVDLNTFYLDKIAQIESNISQRIMTDFRKRLDCLEREVLFLRQENTDLKHSLATIEDSTKILYLRLEGLPESDSSSLPTIVAEALSRTGVNCTTNDLDMVRRVGKGKPNYIRPILIRFHTQSKRDAILFNRYNLNNNPDQNPLWLNDEVSDLTRRNRKTAKGVAFQANSLGIPNTKLHSDGIIIGDSKFKLRDLDLLPPLLTAASAKTLHSDNDIYFQSELAPFSNFFPSLFQDSDSIIFENVEQAFQYRKALFHNNQQVANKIMRTRDPYEHKRLGNFIDQLSQEWRDSEQELMSTLLHYKFTQNSFLKSVLINTGHKSLHEATGDRKWATGSDLLSNATKNKTWPGNDLLGSILAEVRTSLLTASPHPTPSSPSPPPTPNHVDSLSPMPEDDPQESDSLPDPSPSALDPPVFNTQTTPMSTHDQPQPTPPKLSQTPQPQPHLSHTQSQSQPRPPISNPSLPAPRKHSSPPSTFYYPPPSIITPTPWPSTSHVVPQLITRQPMSPAPPAHFHNTNKNKNFASSQSVTDIRRSTRVRSSQSQR